MSIELEIILEAVQIIKDAVKSFSNATIRDQLYLIKKNAKQIDNKERR